MNIDVDDSQTPSLNLEKYEDLLDMAELIRLNKSSRYLMTICMKDFDEVAAKHENSLEIAKKNVNKRQTYRRNH